MVKRNASGTEEPEQKKFELPSEKEHLFQVADIYDQMEHPEGFNIDDPDLAIVKIEVVGVEEEGRTMLNRLTVNDESKGFFATRLFLKAVSLPYKGDSFPIDSDEWQGRQFYALVSHKEYKGKMYANISEYNFDKIVEQAAPVATEAPADKPGQDVAWDE